MATKNVVPRADGEGNLGTPSKRWLAAYFSTQVKVGTGFIRWSDETGLQWSNDGETWVDFENSPDGDVVGPGSATDNAVALFDSTTGKLIKNSTVTISNGNITLASTKTVDGRDVSVDGGTLDSLSANAVIGPASATDNAITRFDSTTGKLVQNSLVTVSDAGNIALPSLATVDGRDVSVDGSALDTLVNTTVPSKVTGPGSSTDNTIARFDGTTGKVVQASTVYIDDSDNVKTAGTLLVGSAGSTNTCAVLQVDSTTKGFQPPRVTTVQKNAISVTGAEGLFVFDTDLNSHCGYTGAEWITYGATGTASTVTMAKLFKVTAPDAETHVYVTSGVGSSSSNTFPGPFTNPDVPRAVSVTFPSLWDGGNITVTGTNASGNIISDTIVAVPSSTVDGVKAFATITGIVKSVVGTEVAAASVGVADIFGVDANIIDIFGMGIASDGTPFYPVVSAANDTFTTNGIASNGTLSFVVTLNIAHTHTIS